jgi:2-polyprenyl-3-methyl-5-hydroxy-6-metoxy-1,4-benzoquinol methylase
MELWPILVAILALMVLTYLNRMFHDRLRIIGDDVQGSGVEGFEDVPGSGPASEVRWMDNDSLYDSFYASVYDQLTQGSVRSQAEVGLILNEWTKRGEDLKTFEVLDAGCGTGIVAASFAKMGCKKVVGIDKSAAMLDQARTKTIPQTTLTEAQKSAIEWRQEDLYSPSAASGGEFSHAVALYFTLYSFADKEAFFRCLYHWIRPGGRLVIHVVNKHKFDPMLESAAPWLGFSLQKYSDQRVTRSEVVFNKFKYTGEFDLIDPSAEFRETFRFSDGTIRRQRHTLIMEDMSAIVNMGKTVGWEYMGFTDLTPISFEYAFHLHFRHP